jgi:hypothetical protein
MMGVVRNVQQQKVTKGRECPGGNWKNPAGEYMLAADFTSLAGTRIFKKL